jgi:hypothetical protein
VRKLTLKTCDFVDIGTLHCALASLGGSASPRLCVRELIAMIFDSVAMIFESVIKMFDSVAMIFESVIKMFDSIAMIFDSVIMIFEPSIKIFDSVVITFEFTAMTFETVVKKFDLCVVKKFDSFIVKKFDLCIIKKFDHNDIIQRAKYFSIKSQFLFYFCYTRYSGAALCKLALQVIDYKSPSRRLRSAAFSTSPPIADSLKRDSPPSGAIRGDNISQSTTLFAYYF